jgi:hypothetical protein
MMRCRLGARRYPSKLWLHEAFRATSPPIPTFKPYLSFYSSKHEKITLRLPYFEYSGLSIISFS